MYTNAKYYNDLLMGQSPAGILCDINGVPSTVPLDPANTDYQNIMQLVAEGKLTIAPAEDPAP
jgi:hypothetical protein